MKNTLVIFQCCKRKNGTEEFPQEDFNLDVRIPKTRRILKVGIQKFSNMGIIDVKSKLITALSRYNGHFYSKTGLKSKVADE